jgi:hypothetical protein
MAGSILGNIIREKILGQPKAPEQQFFMDDPMMGIPLSGSGYSGGMPSSPSGPIVIPPPMEKEIADLYLKVRTPKNTDKLTGIDRYWVFTNDETAVEVPTSNLNAAGQRDILEDLTIAQDLDGCDNVDGLMQNLMLNIHARVLTNKARSDFTDGLRERIVPSVGVSLFGSAEGFGKSQGERPKENRGVLGAIGNQRYS